MKTKFTLLGGAALLAFAGMGTATTVQAKESWGKGAPEFSDPDGNIKFKVRGRVMFDAINVNQDNDAIDATGAANDSDTVGEFDKEFFQTRLRRARLGVEGQFDSKWKYKAEVTLLPRQAATVEWEDLFLEYLGGFGSLVIGNQKIGSPLEEATSSRFISHMERSMLSGAFGFGRTMGVGAVFGGQTNWSLATFVNTDSLNTTEIATGTTGLINEGSIPDETVSFLVHGHWAPLSEPTKILHLGGTVRFRDSGATTQVPGQLFSYGTRAGYNVGDNPASVSSFGDKDTFYGVEAATIVGPFWGSAEYGVLTAENLTGNEAEFSSYNLQAGWFLTGESRGYKVKAGEFDRTTPNAPLNEGGIGAWELRARYDFLDLDDSYTVGATTTQVNGGEATSYTVGVNWSPAKNVRFMGEYVSAEFEEKGTAATTSLTNGDAEVIQFRAQFDF